MNPLNSLIRAKHQDGTVSVLEMTNSQVCELITSHIECRNARRAFNNGELSVDIGGVNYKDCSKLA